MIYFFYSKNDKNKEPIMRTDRLKTKKEAASYFAKIKKMSLDIFLRLFSIGKQKK